MEKKGKQKMCITLLTGNKARSISIVWCFCFYKYDYKSYGGHNKGKKFAKDSFTKELAHELDHNVSNLSDVENWWRKIQGYVRTIYALKTFKSLTFGYEINYNVHKLGEFP